MFEHTSRHHLSHHTHVYPNIKDTAIHPSETNTSKDDSQEMGVESSSSEFNPLAPPSSLSNPRAQYVLSDEESEPINEKESNYKKECPVGIGQGVQMEIFYNHIAGLVQSVSGALFSLSRPANAVRAFKCYRVELKGIPEHFGSLEYGWNQDYSAAQKIYGEGRESAALREAIKRQNKLLYGEMGGFTKQMNKLRKKTCHTLEGGQDLMNILHYGQYRSHITTYTYVLLDDKWCFSRTGKDLFRDFLSKHAVHAASSPKVRFAGEFFILPKHQIINEAGWWLVIDNNSGTFAPTEDGLVPLAELLRDNFPGLYVIALDRESSIHKLLTGWMEENNNTLALDDKQINLNWMDNWREANASMLQQVKELYGKK